MGCETHRAILCIWIGRSYVTRLICKCGSLGILLCMDALKPKWTAHAFILIELRNTRGQVTQALEKLGTSDVVAFQTRNRSIACMRNLRSGRLSKSEVLCWFTRLSA